MTDKDKDFDINDPAISGTGEGQDNFSPSDNGDDLADDKPAVSMNKKKNVVIFAAVFVGFMLIMYSMLNSGKKPKGPVTEVQKMEQTEKAKVPPASNAATKDAISPNAAMPGSNMGVPELPDMAQKRNPQAIQETLPPPPTLPPVFDPASIYVKEDSTLGGTGGGLAPLPSSPTSVFGDKYTKKRSKLPEVDNGGEPGDLGMEGLDPEAQKALEAERKRRLTASMFVGGGGSAPRAEDTNQALNGGIAYGEDYEIPETSASKTDVSIRRDLERVILQGKVMDAVMETAINTDLPGKLRAIVSHDVYSESGKRVVIPKGSRLIGSYATDIKFGQARVYVIWTRVIRPDGVDAVLDGSDDMIATDALGRSGVYGELDNRFFEIFGSSILLSSLTVAFAVAADAAAGGDNTTTSTTPAGTIGAGSTTTSGNVVSQGVSQAVGDLGKTSSDIAKQYFKTKPRITVDQGTRIKIFVNKDIIFPPSYFSSGAVVGTGTMFLN